MNPTCERTPAKRQCYCDSLSAEWKAEQGYAEGFCGVCERCGKPGHTQHFPGPLPYTGSWCDRCVKIVSVTWIFKNPVVLAVLLGVTIFVIHRLLK
jgi:hypothetical protein